MRRSDGFERRSRNVNLFGHPEETAAPTLRQPEPVEPPSIPGAEIGAAYTGERMGGDFFDFLVVNSRLIFLMLDVSGQKASAQNIAALVQDHFRSLAPELFGAKDLNEAVAIVQLTLLLNRAILEGANGICSSSAFLGCYDPQLGTVCYSNAGHVPGLVRDHTGVSQLPATGLPLGLFSHATHDASMTVLEPGAVLLLVSRGAVEARCQGEEYGVEGVSATLEHVTAPSAQRLCVAILDSVEKYMCAPPTHNDVTALALVRAADQPAN
jgi:serine phosphatase RsbU (regulator of sigma subunit)